MIPPDKQSLIYNALMVGMALPEAYIFAGLTESEIAEANADDECQRQWASLTKKFEFQMLNKLNIVIDKQTNMGREQALTWLLERINPIRWGGKATVDSLPDVHIHLADESKMKEVMEVHNDIS